MSEPRIISPLLDGFALGHSMSAHSGVNCYPAMRVDSDERYIIKTISIPATQTQLEALLLTGAYSDADAARNYFMDVANGIVQEVGILEKLAQQLEIGVPTLKDIIAELVKPGRDMRDDLPSPLLREDILDMEDLKAGMQLKGTVRNVIDFGAFVDIGVHQDGLVHLSQICDRFIRHPSEAVKVGDVVDVWVMSVDVAKKRISLTMRDPAQQNKAEEKKENRPNGKNNNKNRNKK